LQDSLRYQAAMHHAHSHVHVGISGHAAWPSAAASAALPCGAAASDAVLPVRALNGSHRVGPASITAAKEESAGDRTCVNTHLAQHTLFTDEAVGSAAAPLLPISSRICTRTPAPGGADRSATAAAETLPSCSLCDPVPHGPSQWVQWPVVFLLRLTMPDVGMGDQVCRLLHSGCVAPCIAISASSCPAQLSVAF
jgi:hypothetical protein